MRIFIPYKTACRVIDHLIQIDALIEFYHDGKSYADKKAITEHFMFIKLPGLVQGVY